MMFDVGIRVGHNAAGKAIHRYYRIHDTLLSESIRKAQDEGQYVFSIIPLFNKKEDTASRGIGLTEKDLLPDDIAISLGYGLHGLEQDNQQGKIRTIIDQLNSGLEYDSD